MKKVIFVLVISVINLACQEDHPLTENEVVESKAITAKELGTKYAIKGDYFKAIEHYYEALEYYREIGDPLQISKVTSNLGNVYSEAGFFSMALNFYHDAFKLRKALNDIEGIAKIYYNIGRAYELNEETDESRRFLNLADSIFGTLSLENSKARILNELGKTHERDSNYARARNYYNNALSIENDKSMRGLLLKNIGYSYHLENNDDQALVYYRKALEFQNDLRSDVRTRLFQNLANIHQDQDSVAWYYAQGLDKDLIWIDDLYLYATHTLAVYHDEKVYSDSARYYNDLVYQGGLKLVKQRDELKRMHDLYQVKYAHYKEQARQQAAILEKEQFQKLLINSVISVVLLMIILYTFNKKRIVREKLKPFLNSSSSDHY